MKRPGSARPAAFKAVLSRRSSRANAPNTAAFYDSNLHYDPQPMATCVRTQLHELTYYRGLEGGKLYDLEKDPDRNAPR